ncbi:protein recA [Striga asiatica]|uniref:Protein recA n=1 Tax=Striga asiatica TaxID=4170 RepID=A0A5A7R8Z9_STRAF|nr:protein recA [Striga asiatica]
MSSLSSVEAELPPGFRFHPRDEELVCDYLMKRVTGRPTHPFLIHLDLHNCEPWDLPDIACVGGKEWYFYTQRDRKYATGLRTNRATKSGYWKATGKDRPVTHKGKRVGMRKTLVFYAGRAPKGSKTEWVMHEYRLEGTHYGPGLKAVCPVKEDWVLCKVFFKKGTETPTRIQVETKPSSPSLPPLMEPYNNNSINVALNQSNDVVNKHVPCFSIYSTNTTYDINPSFMNDYPFPSRDNGVIKVVLSQLAEMDAANDFGEGSSGSYLSQAVWNPYPGFRIGVLQHKCHIQNLRGYTKSLDHRSRQIVVNTAVASPSSEADAPVYAPKLIGEIKIMGSSFPLQTQHSSSSSKIFCHQTFRNSPSPRSSIMIHALRPSPVEPKRIRVRSEFDGKVNGSFSADFDSRFLDRQKALEAAMNDINSSFGKGSVTRLGSAGGALVETFPSGCLTLDFALGGGLPRGRIVEIYGPESSGKTTLALHAIAEVQRLGGNAMLVDAEHAFDPAYSKALGVDVENLIVCQPDNGEMALEIADRICRSGAVDLICIDSVSALTPRAEIEGEIGMQQMGLQARLMSQALRKMSGNASKAGCTLIFLNQIRYKIGVYYGNPEVTSGGIALKFFASVRLEIRPIGKIKSVKGDEDVGLKVRVRVQKSKVSRPYKQAEFEIIFGEGVSKLGCMLDCAEMTDVVLKKGSWYSYGDNRLGQGRERALQHLRENPQLCEEIETKVRAVVSDNIGQVGSYAKSSLPQTDEEDVYQEMQ